MRSALNSSPYVWRLSCKELLGALQKDPDETRRHLSEALRKLTVLRVNEKKLSRRYVTLVEQEQHLRKENDKLKDESSQMQASVTQRLGYLQRYKVQKVLSEFVNMRQQHTERSPRQNTAFLSTF